MSKSFIESIIPFITNMRKGIASEDAPVTSLIPFENGQTIKGFDFGNVKNGDVSAELSNFLLTKLPDFGGSESTTGYFVAGNGDTSLMGYNMNNIQEGLGIIFTSDNNMTILYSTQDFNIEGTVGTKGFQNLTDGKYILGDSEVKTSTIDEISGNIEDTSWNGTLIGAVEGEPSPTPTTYTITTNSIDNTTISGSGTYEEGTDVVVSIQANNGYYFVDTPTATEGGEALELTNVDGVYSATITVHQDVLVEFVATVESDQPTVASFYDKQIINQGDKVFVDTTKASELQSWLETNVNADNPQVPLVYAPQSTSGQAFVLMGMYADGGYGVMAVAGQNMIMLYNDQDGFNESGLVDSCFVIPEEAGQDYYYTVSTISPDDSWNGTIFSYLAKE